MNAMFVYGTLLNDEVLALVLGRVCKQRKASLRGYQRLAVLNEAYPAIRPVNGREAKESEVKGAVLSGLNEADIAVLDRYEGEFYSRQTVLVHLSDGSAIPSMTYVFKPQYYHLLTDNSWSNTYFRRKDLHDFLRMLAEGEA